MSLLISNARVIDPASQLDQVSDVYIADGKIVALGSSARSFSAETTLDAAGLCLAPGFIDLSVRLPEPGFEHKGTVASETLAAAAGGVTAVCCTPDTSPVIDSPSVATLIQDRGNSAGKARVFPLGAVTKGLQGSLLSEMYALKSAGCIAVTNMRAAFDSTRVLLHCLEYAASLDLTVFLSPVDATLQNHGCAHEGVYATRLGLAGIPETAETVALTRDLLLVEQSGVRAHFCQLSCARSVELVAAAQARGLPVTADTTIHHLMYSEANIRDFNSLYHLQPPLRTPADQLALRNGVKDGVICAITSMHQPHESAAKMAPFAATEPGIAGLQTLLPLGLQLVEAGILSLSELIARLTAGPAHAAGIEGGTLSPGETADLCIFDPEECWRVDESNWLSEGKNTPLWHNTVRGKVKMTLVAGNKVYQAH